MAPHAVQRGALHRSPGRIRLQNPTDTLLHLQLLTFPGLFPLFALFEGAPALSMPEELLHFHEAGMLFAPVGKLFLGGILAFGLGFSKFLLVSRTSRLTLPIAGIFAGRHGSRANTGGQRSRVAKLCRLKPPHPSSTGRSVPRALLCSVVDAPAQSYRQSDWIWESREGML
ncbi:solute carrier family 35 member C2 [Rhynochetos jubatus]